MKQGSPSMLSPSGVGQSLRRLFYSNPLYRLTLKGRTPDTLRIRPPSYRLGDPEIGRAILNGTFSLSHHRTPLGEFPWTMPLESPLQSAELHGFSWLADLFAAGSDEARMRAGELLRSWVEHNRKWQELSWRATIK